LQPSVYEIRYVFAINPTTKVVYTLRTGTSKCPKNSVRVIARGQSMASRRRAFCLSPDRDVRRIFARRFAQQLGLFAISMLLTHVVAGQTSGLAGSRGVGSAFEAGCALPFASIAERRPVDDMCGASGSDATPANQARSRAKNNFCATGPIVPVTFDALRSLQEAVTTVRGGDHATEQNRSAFASLGEGKRVQLMAYALSAHFADVMTGENVTCHLRGQANNDIHLSLSPRPGAALCESITAEISPHFRPAAWEGLVVQGLPNRPLRVTGQLFFDDQHVPCHDGRGAPARMSVCCCAAGFSGACEAVGPCRKLY